MTTLNAKTKRALAKYGKLTCLKMFRGNENGWGASNLGFEYGLTTNQADAAINAGRAWSEQFAHEQPELVDPMNANDGEVWPDPVDILIEQCVKTDTVTI